MEYVNSALIISALIAGWCAIESSYNPINFVGIFVCGFFGALLIMTPAMILLYCIVHSFVLQFLLISWLIILFSLVFIQPDNSISGEGLITVTMISGFLAYLLYFLYYAFTR
jgi:hypothetical protein